MGNFDEEGIKTEWLMWTAPCNSNQVHDGLNSSSDSPVNESVLADNYSPYL